MKKKREALINAFVLSAFLTRDHLFVLRDDSFVAAIVRRSMAKKRIRRNIGSIRSMTGIVELNSVSKLMDHTVYTFNFTTKLSILFT
jgi:hypothetical protein